MALLRQLAMLLLALLLCFAAPAGAESPPIGPMCLEMARGTGKTVLTIFALPMGETVLGSQFLLSAVIAGLPYTGAARLEGQLARFTLIAGFPGDQGVAAGAFSGKVDLQTGTGDGKCAAIDDMAGTGCAPPAPVTFTLISCD